MANIALYYSHSESEMREEREMIKSVKFWKANKYHQFAGEIRIYAETTSGKRDCLYVTGNRYQKPGSVDGDFTEDDWNEARQIALDDAGKWHTVYDAQKLERSPRYNRSECVREDIAENNNYHRYRFAPAMDA